MKRLPTAACLLLLLSGLAHAAFGIFQTYAPAEPTFNPVVVATEQHVFSMDPQDTSNYLVPGMGQPAISTAMYYNMFGLYPFRPYDLDTMGAAGAAVKAANGGKRYVWPTSSDHPIFGYGARGGTGFFVGYSHQPWDFPAKLEEIIPVFGSNQTPQHTVNGGFNSYEFIHLTYNPDDADGLPFYVFVEAGPDHWTALWRSSDMVNFTLTEISHWHPVGNAAFTATVSNGGSGYSPGTQLLTVTGGTCTVQPQFNVTVVAGAITSPVRANSGTCTVNPSNPGATTGGGGTGGTLNVTYGAEWSSFVRYSERTGTNAFTTIALSGITPPNVSLWTTTNGIDYTTAYVPILGMEGSPDSAGSTYAMGGTFTIGSQRYIIARENATGGSQYVTVYPADLTTFDKQSSPSKVRLASGWNGNAGTGFPGPNFLQEATAYYEDGIAYILPLYGFPSDVNTTLGQGGPYQAGTNQYGLDQQFVDKLVVRMDDTAARLAAPVGMGVSSASGTATISWKNGLPQNTYRLYRGTNATTQATLIGDYTGVTSATDSPSTGRYWYKLVTLDNGTERKSRVLSTYVSSSSAFVNQHMDRALEDGADPVTCNRAFMDRADAMLDTVGIRSILEIWTHPAFCVKQSAGVISKIYDFGTTRLPRSDDLKTTTSSTTYSATSVNTGPGWTNANNNSYAYWGSTKRGNTIQQKRQITILAAYERTQTSEDLTFMGIGPIFGTSLTGNAIIGLTHKAGSPGTIEFSLSDDVSTKTASVTASGSGMQIAIGTYDGAGGTGMIAYTGSTAGTAVTTLDPNPDFGKTTGNPKFILGSLAGSRNTNNNGGAPDFGPSPFPAYFPFLGSGSIQNYTLRRGQNSGIADVVNFNETNAKGKMQTVMQLGGAINSTQIGQIITELQSTVNW